MILAFITVFEFLIQILELTVMVFVTVVLITVKGEDPVT